MTPAVQTYPLSYWSARLAGGPPITLSRWGDGEWACLLGDAGANCDGHAYFPALAADLRAVLMANQPYAKGWLAVSRAAGKARIHAWLARHTRGVAWVDGDVFLRASCAGRFAPFVRVLRQKRVLYVGPDFLRPCRRGWAGSTPVSSVCPPAMPTARATRSWPKCRRRPNARGPR